MFTVVLNFLCVWNILFVSLFNKTQFKIKTRFLQDAWLQLYNREQDEHKKKKKSENYDLAGQYREIHDIPYDITLTHRNDTVLLFIAKLKNSRKQSGKICIPDNIYCYCDRKKKKKSNRIHRYNWQLYDIYQNAEW